MMTNELRLESYDLFDTLITRITRKPIDVFRLLGASGAVHFRWKVASLIPFHVWRRYAERFARHCSSREDIQLKDIYRVLGAVIQQPARVMRQEIALEEAVIRPLPANVNQLMRKHRAGFGCCIISDMYLSHSALSKLVRTHVGNLPIYVSSEVGLTKGSGGMFEHVANSEGVTFAEMHHYGDNLVADHAIPLKLGIKNTLIPVKQEGRAVSLLDTLKCPREGDALYEMGFRVAGPTAFVMAAYLAGYVKKHPPRNIIFAARDMHLVKHAFHLLSNYEKTHYCRISRSAVYRAQWHANSDPKRWFEGVGSGDEFFKRLGICCPEDMRELVPHQHPQLFMSALQNSGFPQECAKEYNVVYDYLVNEGFQGGTLFVDLGWRGSIHDAVNDILNLEQPVEGYYFGTLESSSLKHGFYFSGSKPAKRFHRILQAVSFFEFLFTEGVPSVARIIREGHDFGQVPTEDETQEQHEARVQIAEGARDYIETMVLVHKAAPLDSERLLQPLDEVYNHYLLTPPAHWVAALETMTHSGGFGGSGTSPLIGDEGGSPIGFLKAPWKGGYAVKHRASLWAPIFSAMHNWPFFVVYDALKRSVRQHRAAKLRQ